MIHKYLLTVCLIAITVVAYGVEPKNPATACSVISPNGKIKLNLFRGADGQLGYAISSLDKIVISPSDMRLKINNIDFGSDVTIKPSKTYALNEKYPWRGIHNEAIDHCNGAEFTVFDKKSNETVILEARAYDNGVCFRFRIEKNGKIVISQDLTQFSIPQDSTIWAVMRKEEGLVGSMKISSNETSKKAPPCLPMTAKLPNGTYISIMEAARGTFPGVRTLQNISTGIFELKISGAASAENKLATPWRVVKIASNLNGLVNNDMLHNLSPKADPKFFPKGVNTDWVKPGKIAWSWMSAGGAEGVNLKTQKEFVDYSQKMGYEFILVDEGWRHWNETGQYGCNVSKCKMNHGDAGWNVMKELVEYAKARNVGVWVWKAFGSRRNIPGIKEPIPRRNFLKKCHELGIVGVKLDFFPAPSQSIMKWQEDTLREAAEMKLMVNFHGCAVPDGLVRTWPNEMTREAIRGLEYSGRTNHAYQLTVLPFTRMLAGHGDFTPLFIGRGRVSLANHIAAIAVMDSSVTHFCSHPRDIQQIGDEASKFIMEIPETWDETIVLPSSQIGEVVAFARRKGNVWYLTVLNSVSKDLVIPLSFLKKACKYKMIEIRDGEPSKNKIVIKKESTDNSGNITLKLKNASGYIASFTEVL